MKTRMEKYEVDEVMTQRSEKNKKLYDEVQDMNIDYIDIDVNNAIDLSDNDDSSSRANYQKQKELSSIISTPKVKEEISSSVEPVEDRVHDINEILKLAKENKLFEEKDSKKRMLNTEYNILTKLDIDKIDDNEFSKDNLHDLIDSIYQKEEETKENEKIDVSLDEDSNDLFDDLKEENVDDVKEEDIDLNEEVSKKILDKGEDSSSSLPVEAMIPVPLEDEIDLDKEVKNDIKKDSVSSDTSSYEFEEEEESKALIFVIIFVIVLLLVAAYLILKYFNVI